MIFMDDHNVEPNEATILILYFTCCENMENPTKMPKSIMISVDNK